MLEGSGVNVNPSIFNKLEFNSMVSFFSRLVNYLLPATLFYFFQYMILVAPGAMKSELSVSLSANASQFNALTSYYLLAYACAQIPIGMVIDKFLPRRALSLACLFYGIFIIVFALSPSVGIAQISRIFMGICGGFGLLSCLKIAALYFDDDEYATLTGMILTVGMIGAYIGQSGAEYGLRLCNGNWSTLMLFAGVFAIVMSIALFFKLVDPESAKEDAAKLEVDISGLLSNMKIVLGRLNVWTIALYAAFMFMPTIILTNWGVSFLTEAHGLSRASAGFFNANVFLGFASGAPIYGYVSDKYNSRFALLYFANIMTILLVLLYLFMPHGTAGVVFGIIAFFIGVFSSGFILAFVLAKDMNPIYLSGTASGFVNTANQSVGAIAAIFVSGLLDKYGTKVILSTGEAVYDLAAYSTSLQILPYSLVFSLISLMITHYLWIKQKS